MDKREIDLDAIVRGDTVKYKVMVTLPDGTVPPGGIAGTKLMMTLKRRRTDADADAAAQVIDTVPDDADAAAGIGFVTLPSDITVIDTRKYFYDIQWVQAGAPPIVTTPQWGRVEIVGDITRATA